MMADIQGKSKSLADEIVEQRMVIFMEKKMKKKKRKSFWYIDLEGNFLASDSFKLYFFCCDETSDNLVLIEIVSSDRAERYFSQNDANRTPQRPFSGMKIPFP